MHLLIRLAAVSVMGVASVGAGTVAWANAEAATPSSVVQGFAYPDADQILANHGVKLKNSDGNILFVDCDVPGDVIQVEAYGLERGFVCFQLRGTTGYLSLEITGTAYVRSENRPIEATVRVGEETGPGAPQMVPANTWTPFGSAANVPSTTLLELRV